MLELIQFPFSPFCIVQRRILEYSGVPFRLVNIPSTDRSLVWKLTRQRYYEVPILRDGRNVLFEVDDHSQVLAKYLDSKLQLGLFPSEWEGIQSILWEYIENEIEGCTFRLNDVHWQENVPKKDQLQFLRHKERKFGRGCLDQWGKNQSDLLDELTRKLLLFEQMLAHRPFLLDQQPRFIDFDLFGMLGNFLYAGHYALPTGYSALAQWYQTMTHSRRASGRSKTPSKSAGSGPKPT